MPSVVSSRYFLSAAYFRDSHVSDSSFICAGMHKKSVEAADVLKDDENDDSNEGEPAAEKTKDADENPAHREEMRSNSIASLRQKAQEHAAKLTGQADYHGDQHGDRSVDHPVSINSDSSSDCSQNHKWVSPISDAHAHKYRCRHSIIVFSDY